MSLIKTDNGRMVFKDAVSMMVIPYVYDENIGDYVLGSDIYDISAIIGDSIVIEQSDGDKTTKENEFTSVPLLETFTNGKYVFTAQCVDLQNGVLKSLMGAMTASGNNGAVEGAAAFNDNVSSPYALVRIRFGGNGVSDVFLPKVQLNSRLFIQQLKTRAGQGNVSGTAFAKNVAIKDNDAPGYLLQFSSIGGTPTYTPYTPVLFVPVGCTPLFKHDDKSYDIIDFSNGVVSNNIAVNGQGGTWQNIVPEGGLWQNGIPSNNPSRH